MKRHVPITKTVAIGLILGVTAFASSAEAQPPVVFPPQIAPEYNPLTGNTQTGTLGVE